MREHIARSIALAAEAGARGDRPFGAVLLSPSGTVLAEGQNRVTSTGDFRAHAELDALTLASPGAAIGATMIASGEPCPMCAAGMVWAGITRIVFAVAEPDFAAILTDGPRFRLRCAEVIASCSENVQVEGPVGTAEALTPFHDFKSALP